MSVERQRALSLNDKGLVIDCGFCVDFMVNQLVSVEVKAIDRFAPVHEAQVITYLKLTGCKLGLLLNFSEYRLRDGIKRVVHGL